MNQPVTLGRRMPGNNCPLNLSPAGNSGVDCWLADSDGDLADFIRVRNDRGSVAASMRSVRYRQVMKGSFGGSDAIPPPHAADRFRSCGTAPGGSSNHLLAARADGR